MSEPAERLFTVAAPEAGSRLDLFLDRRCPDLSRSHVQRALAAGRALVDGRPRRKSFRVGAGQQVRFRPLPPASAVAEPEDLPLAVVYEDEDLLVVDKPAGLVVHPAPGHRGGTLVNAVLGRRGRFTAGGDPLRPGIVHRLDRDTSGLLVVALNERSHRSLAGQLAARRMGRLYLALSWGRWAEPEGEIDLPIGRHPRRRQRMAVVARGGRPARTTYRVAEDHGFAQLCEVRLRTGRTHQIRVHFAHLGHPVVGDPVYGDDRRARGVAPALRGSAEGMVARARRQMLHAARLSFRHPRTGKELSFTAPPPADLGAVLAWLRGGAAPDKCG